MRPRKKRSNKQDPQDFAESIIYELRIAFDRVSIQLRQLAESVANLNKKLDQMREELNAELNRSTQRILDALAGLNRNLDNYHQGGSVGP
jgi:outer membrane murein-binding lipoprotein Lpp